ncbi:MAG: response regulator transcription factor [Thermoleophilia bacterium]|nr:response regulator transcription factor [Thermoleophilia bacterium]
MSKIRILLADDHAILRSGLMRLLGEESDIEIVGEAENGREAVQKTQELHPDIVLMDIGMPVMNGMEATKQIKKRDNDVKVLVLTMHDNEEYLFQVLQAGASGYVLKKAADSDLVNAIHVVSRGDCFLYPSAAKMVVEDYLEKLKAGQEPTSSFDALTEREREILRLVAEGYTNREIAESLFISVKTVETHKANIMEKLNLHKRAELVRYAIRKGILQVDFDEMVEHNP